MKYLIIHIETHLYFRGFSKDMVPRFTANKSMAMKFNCLHAACDHIALYNLESVAYLSLGYFHSLKNIFESHD